MGSVAGGGRYDELVGMFDAKGRQVCVRMKNEGRGGSMHQGVGQYACLLSNAQD